ncbi:MAG TPA: hypothetical protein PKA13_12960 [Geminicoccaceae bacterium]|nr:hypothetical protein [Geminicoccus sp.]HMU50677.1 hypothetical protein [Geminicoccaceae bacterium]
MLRQAPVLRRAYVGSIRAVQPVARRVGLISWLERRRDRRPLFWARSLFAIWDIEQMIALDIPWWTFDAIDRVDAFLRATPKARVFEYGAGASTIWLAKRAGSVAFVEHDRRWMDQLGPHLAGKAHVRGQLAEPVRSAAPACPSEKPGWEGFDFAGYVAAIDRAGGPFDLVVVDGRARSHCLERAVANLAPGGIVVFDNSARARYRPAIEAQAMKRLELRGLTPCLPYPDQTTLLAADDRAARLIGA